MPGLQITIKAENTQGRVDIIGNISEWNQNNAIDFRERCQAIKDAGATSCHLYLMTNGGDCIQANEIYNILIDLFGEYTGEGGAIVASAGTFLAVKAKTFVMAKNGQFMVHQPQGGVQGTATQIENYLQLVKNMLNSYYEAYKVKLKKTEADFKTKWDAGDFWMTAKEAVEWGFVTSIKEEPAKLTKALAAEIKAIGSPIDFSPEDIISNQNNENKMNLQAIALTLGLAANATEADITAKIAENAQKAKDYDALKAATELKEKTEKADKIKAALDKAEKEHRITADTRPNWQAMLEANYDITIKAIEAIQVVAPLSGELVVAGENGTKTYNGKTFEQLQDDPKAMEALQNDKPEVYDALFADWKERNGIN
ncbi:MAG: hypothetical protein EOM47_01135 [Bacteroidia bacterium]|nr:hypothetical protein [Bacteroidia bacterium]